MQIWVKEFSLSLWFLNSLEENTKKKKRRKIRENLKLINYFCMLFQILSTLKYQVCMRASDTLNFSLKCWEYGCSTCSSESRHSLPLKSILALSLCIGGCRRKAKMKGEARE